MRRGDSTTWGDSNFPGDPKHGQAAPGQYAKWAVCNREAHSSQPVMSSMLQPCCKESVMSSKSCRVCGMWRMASAACIVQVCSVQQQRAVVCFAVVCCVIVWSVLRGVACRVVVYGVGCSL